MERPTEKFKTPAVQFVSEQDGPIEQQFKDRVRQVLIGRVKSAFLARVAYSDPNDTSVALCVSTPEDPALVSDVAGVFKSMFRSDVHIDILFVSPEQEIQLRLVCKPFVDTPSQA